MDSEGVPATKLSDEAKESKVFVGENDSSVVESNETLMKEKMTLNTDETLTEDKGGCSSTSEEEEGKKNLLHADELMEKGSKAIEAGDYAEAVDCLSRAVEIRVANYGELAPECVSAYYKYGCALLYKAQEETDPLGNIINNNKSSVDLEAKTSVTAGSCESSIVMGDINGMHYGTTASKDEELEKANGKDKADGNDGSEGEDVVEENEDEDGDDSDLDLAWKTLDIARAIIEKSPTDTIEKVNIFSALGEVSLEREDIETSLSDYKKALLILEHLVESDSRRIAELNFRICLVLEVGSRVEDAIPYCQKAISVCRARLQRLANEVNAFTCLDTKTDTHSGPGKELPNRTSLDASVLEKQEEIETLSGLSTELGKKLEDLQQSLLNPNSSLTEFMKMLVSKSKERTKPFDQKEAFSDLATSSRMSTIKGTSDSPTVSTGASNNVTHLGVVGRGIKRALVQPVNVEPIPKKVSMDLSIKDTEVNASGGFPPHSTNDT